jgi:glycosyltransferase involved in cell wall biosynthesis
MSKLLSVAIPTYEMHGLGAAFLAQSFDILTAQTFKDFDVVVSDHSKTDEIRKVCDAYADKIDIKYFKNEEKRGNSPANTNNAIKKSQGKLIKILFQDDFLYHEKSLEDIAKSFDLHKDAWLITGSESTMDTKVFFRPHTPYYDDRTILRTNTISSPSVLTIKNKDPLFFDENLVWWMDLDYYKRCYERFGKPKILDSINVVNRVGAHQISSTRVDRSLKAKEYRYVLKKHNMSHVGLTVFFYRMSGYAYILKKKIKKLI